MKHLIVGLTVAALGFTSVVGSAKGPKPDGTIALSGGSVAAGAGFSSGRGDLTYHGKKYAITADGFDVGDVGLTRMSATGNVYNLKRSATSTAPTPRSQRRARQVAAPAC